MKKLFWVLALLCAPAFGQVYSEQAIQNTTGNWLKASPGAQVYLCTAASTLANCTGGFATTVIYTDQNLNVPLAQPILADSNGNFTIFTTPGVFNLCVKGATTYCELISIGGGGNIVCPGAINGSIAAFTSPTNTSCDPTFLTDFFGNFTAQSGRFLGPVNGFLGLIGGGSDPGTQVKYKLATNEFRWLANTIPTPYYARVPSVACTLGQVWAVTGSTTDANGDVVTTYGCSTVSGGGGGGAQFQTEGINNANCSGSPVNCPLLNHTHGNTFLGTTIQPANPSGGIEQFNFSTPGVAQPATPSCTQNGTTGATTYTYKVVACQDSGGSCTNHTVDSATCSVANGNATLTSVNSITLTVSPSAQVRCYDWYRTAGGATQGKIASCAENVITDTGLAASGSSANTQTTQLVARFDGYGCNVHPQMVSFGTVDIWPCSPNTLDSEFTGIFGLPGDVNSKWKWLNQGSCTATWTNGMLSIACPSNGAGVVSLRCLVFPLGSIGTSYTITAVLYNNYLETATNDYGGVALYESGTGKIVNAQLASNPSGTPGPTDVIQNFTNTTTLASTLFLGVSNTGTNPRYIRVQRVGANLNFLTSPDGVVYTQQATQAVTSGFTTAPDNFGMCLDPFQGQITTDYDYIRVTAP